MLAPALPLLLLLSLLAIAFFSHPCCCQTTVPIYLPDYDPKSWDLVRGSIIAKDDKLTTYTVFCPPQTPPACDIGLEFPFVFAEGPSTLQFHGTVHSTFTDDLECQLSGTTAALCSGYSSLGEGYSVGTLTGPTQASWTSSLTGSDVQWGVLTIVDDPSTTDSLDLTATANTPDETGALGASKGSEPSLPEQTGTSAGYRQGGGAALVVGICSSLVVSLTL